MSTSPDSNSGAPLAPNEDTSILASFRRHARTSNWEENSAEYRSKRAHFVRDHFEAAFGSSSSNLAGWQALCRAVGIMEIPSSITGCKKVRSTIVIRTPKPKNGWFRDREREMRLADFYRC